MFAGYNILRPCDCEALPKRPMSGQPRFRTWERMGMIVGWFCWSQHEGPWKKKRAFPAEITYFYWSFGGFLVFEARIRSRISWMHWRADRAKQPGFQTVNRRFVHDNHKAPNRNTRHDNLSWWPLLFFFFLVIFFFSSGKSWNKNHWRIFP